MIPVADPSCHVQGILSHHGQAQVVQTNLKLERNLLNSQMTYLTLQEVSVGIGRPGESMIPEANRSFHVHVILSHHGQPQVVQTNPKLERNLINTQMTYLTLQEASAGIDL